MIQLHVYIMLTVEVRYDVQVLASVLRVQSRRDTGLVSSNNRELLECVGDLDALLNSMLCWLECYSKRSRSIKTVNAARL